MKVGDTVYIRPTFGETKLTGEPQPAKVVYIHPARHYYESYPGAATLEERMQKNEKNSNRKSKRRRR